MKIPILEYSNIGIYSAGEGSRVCQVWKFADCDKRKNFPDSQLLDILPPYTFQREIFLMAMSTVFTNNRTQAVRLPAEVRLPEGVKRVSVRAVGNERIIAPVENTWDSFFMNSPKASDDFMPERASQQQGKREALE